MPQDLTKLKIKTEERSLSSGRKRKKRFFFWFVPLVLAVLIFTYLYFAGFLSRPIEVQTLKVGPTFASRALTVANASGYVVAQRKAAVSSKATGRLRYLYVEEGKKVKEGDILGTLENSDLEASLQEAEALQKVANAALNNAKAELVDATLNFNRIKSLRETGSVSVQAFDTAEARYKKAIASEFQAQFGVERANAAFKVAEVNLEYSFIRAPFDGVILTKNADIGEVVAPFGASLNAKAAVVTMADMESLMVEVDVSESTIEKVKVGGAVEIRLDALPNDRFPGTVHMIVPTADRSKATVLTKIKFDHIDPRILPEMSAKAAFLSRPLKEDERQSFIGIPAVALRKKTDNAGTVFVLENDYAHERPVKLGRTWNDVIEVLDGIKEGEIIISFLDDGIHDGSRVKVKE